MFNTKKMLLIYVESVTSRCKYVLELIFTNELGIEYNLITDRKIFEEYQSEKINYSSAKIGDEIFIHASHLLFESSIEKFNTTIEIKHGIAVLFPNSQGCDAGFDIFAAVFYMVSRYEEYLPFSPDKHGRFKASDSIAYKNNFLQYPVVNHWIKYLKQILLGKFPSLKFKQQSFKTIITYDIDIAYSFRGRTPLRTLSATAKDIFTLKFKNIFNRYKALVTKKDPWDVYDSLKETIINNKLTSIFFFLLGDYSRYDKNIKYDDPLMVDLIKKISAFGDIGIHPSYKSSNMPEKILIEKARLARLSNNPIRKSRQHYLRFTLPDTYNQLLVAGIVEDYSMGFADMPGFRAGICTPFYFYDLTNEKQTQLKLYPATCMDTNFIHYSKLNPSESLDVVFNLLEKVKSVNGIFISIWHNNTLSDNGFYKGWKQLHEGLIKKLK